MVAVKMANLGLRLLVELGALVAVGYWGFHTGGAIATKIGLGLGAPLLLAVVWGVVMAPTSSRRAPEPWYTVLEIIIFGLASVALVFAGQPILALVFGVVAAINAALCKLWRDALPDQLKAR